MNKTILNFGEMLWDHFPDYERPGGSPFNVTVHLHYLKQTSLLISAVGLDEAGSRLLDILVQQDAPKRFIQRIEYPTGTVSVEFDKENEPSYTIHERVAWDFIQPPDELQQISSSVDAFSFATLAQRSSTNRITLQKIFSLLPDRCLKFLDVNLRPPYVKTPVIEFSLKKCNYVKMNQSEWNKIGNLFETKSEMQLIEKFDLDGMILTLGSEGAIYFNKDGSHFVESAANINPEKGGDFVGVGDAFWACFIYHTLKKTPWQEAVQKSNLYAGWVAEQKGGIPEPDEEVLQSVR
ncbi:hypothetical protein DYD21_05985 [Rhodohalobacter sp. SW132]|uniref:PfkB family carbohydrate kinase n=1 Tax=Rhodohalobacter sp. SW132 TaxID=2293433 RepID=UPI000E274366|nr:PfkB family carbohydrate kinase [Rhodohalobacter sp. SW132]REL38157.1 hypothetical protein DYD21_05985 [Rhodohalobacter sp. SW132]